MANDVDSSLQDPTRQPSALRALADRVSGGAQRGDTDAVLAAVRERATVASPEESARLWLSVAEHWAADVPQVRRTALEAAALAAWSVPPLFAFLRDSFRRADDAEGRRATLTAEATRSAEPETRVAAWQGLAALATRAGEPDAALEAHVRVAAEGPHYAAEAMAAIDALAAEVDPGAWRKAQEAIARHTDDARTVLRVLDGKLQRALDEGADPTAIVHETTMAALDAGAGADAAMGYVDDAWHRAPSARSALLGEAAAVAERDGGDRTLAWVAGLFASVEQWPDAVSWYQRAAEAAQRADRRATHWIAAGDIQADTLGEVGAAIQSFQRAAEADEATVPTVRERLERMEAQAQPSHLEAIRGARAALLESGGDWVGLHEVLVARVQGAEGNRRAQLLIELADLQGAQLQRPDLAAISLGQALESGPEGAVRDEVVERLEVLLNIDAGAARAAELLSPVYRANDDAQGLIRSLTITAERADKGPARGAAWAEIGQLRVESGQRAGAIDALQRAELEGAGIDRALLRRLLREEGRFEDALAVLAVDVVNATPEERTALEVERADTLIGGGATAQAIAYAYVARGAVADPDAIDARFDAIARREDAFEAARVAAARLARQNPGAASDLAWRAARANGLGSKVGAQLAVLAAEMAPLDAVRFSQLHTAVAAANDTDLSIAMHRALLHHAPTGAEALTSRQALGALLAPSDPEAARGYLFEALSASPDDVSSHDALLAIARAEGDPGALTQALEGRLEHLTLDVDEASAHLSELVRLYGTALGRDDLAFATARRLLDVDPTNEIGHAAVLEYTEDRGDIGLRYEVLASTLEDIDDSAQRGTRLRELALAAKALDAHDTAAQHLLDAAREPGVDANIRRAAAEEALAIRFERAELDAVGEVFATLAPLLDGDDRAAAAEETIDRLSEPRADLALAAASDALSGWETPSAGVLDRHAQLARRAEQFDDAIRSLQTWVSRDGAAVPIDRRAQLAVLQLEHIDGDAGWTSALRVLAQDPDQFDVVLKLEELRDAQAEIGELASALADVTAEEGPELRIRALYRAADLAGSDHPALAEQFWRTVLALDTTEEKALDSLRGALRDREDSEGEIALLREMIEHVDEDTRTEFLREIAGLAGDDAALEEAHLDVLATDLADVPARLALADLYERTERYERAVEMLEEAAPLADSDEDARAYWTRAADLCESKLENAERAAANLEALVASIPTDIETLKRLAESYESRSQWENLVRTLTHHAGVASDDDVTARLWERIARVEELERGEAVAAVDALEKVVALEPANLPALQDIARLQESLENWNAFVDALDRIAQAAAIPALRDEILLRAAPVLLDKLDRAEDAQNVLQQVVARTTPTDETLDLFRRATGAASAWLPFAGTLRDLAARTEDAERRLALELEVTDVLAGPGEDPSTAVTYLSERFAADPAMGPRLEKLEAIAAEHKLRTHLVESYKKLSAAFPDDSDVQWHALSGSADIAENVVGHPQVAFGIMARATEKPALRERAEEEMRRISETHGLWDEYRDYLDAEASEAGEDDAIDLVVRRAAVEREKLGDWEAAFNTLMTAYQDAPFDERIREPFFALAEERSGWLTVAKLHEMLQEHATGRDKALLISEIAAIYADRLDKPADAFSQQVRAWQLDPSDEEMRERLEARAEAAGAQVDLLATYEWASKQPAPLAQKLDALERASTLALALNFTERARALFVRTATEGAPDDAFAVMEKADAAFTERDARHESVALAQEIGAATQSGEEWARILIRGAEVAAELGDTDARVACLRTALQKSPTPATVRPLLIDALRDQGDVASLAKQLEAHAAEGDAASTEAATEELMRLYRTELGDEERAVSLARRLMDMRPDDDSAADAYVDQLTTLERWPDLIEHHLRRADATEDADAARSSRLEAARVAEEHLDDPRRALRIADTILATVPGDRAALELRARTLASLSRWGEHIEALEQLAAASAGNDAAAVFGQAAAVFEHQLLYSDKALAMWRRASEADPSYGRAFAEQARIVGESGDIEAAIPLWEKAVGALENGAHGPLAEALTSLAIASRQAGTDHDRASLLGRAVELAPRDVFIREQYELALAESGNVDALLSLFDAEFHAAESDHDKAIILLRRAVVTFFDGDNEADALKALNRARELGAGRGADCIEGDIHLVRGRWEDAARSYAAGLGDSETVDPATTLHPRAMMPGEDVAHTAVSIVYLTRAGYAQEGAAHIGRAQDYYTSAHLEDDSYGPAIVGLARLALRRGTPEGARIYFAAYRATAPHDPALDAEVANLERSAGG